MLHVTPNTQAAEAAPWEPHEIERDSFAVPIYGFVAPFFVLVSMATNCLVCAVLTRRAMRSCTNVVLAGLAASDSMTGLWPLPCFFYFYTLRNHLDYLVHDWCFAYFCLTDYLPTAFHTASVWLTVLLAFQRFLHVCRPSVARRFCTVPRTLKVVLATYAAAVSTQLCRLVDGRFVPVSVRSLLDPERNVTACIYVYHPFVEQHINVYFGIFYWFRVLFVHILPCLVLVALNSALVRTITDAQRRRNRLLRNRSCALEMQQLRTSRKSEKGSKKVTAKTQRKQGEAEESRMNSLVLSNPAIGKIERENGRGGEGGGGGGTFVMESEGNFPPEGDHRPRRIRTSRNDNNGSRHRDNNSTTLMLVVVVGIFLLVELPLAVLFILNFVDNTWSLELLPKSSIHTATLFINVITIVSYSCNFFVYCAMSNQFRRNFKELFQLRNRKCGHGPPEASTFPSRNRNKSEASKLMRSTFIGHSSIHDDCLLSPSPPPPPPPPPSHRLDKGNKQGSR